MCRDQLHTEVATAVTAADQPQYAQHAVRPHHSAAGRCSGSDAIQLLLQHVRSINEISNVSHLAQSNIWHKCYVLPFAAAVEVVRYMAEIGFCVNTPDWYLCSVVHDRGCPKGEALNNS